MGIHTRELVSDVAGIRCDAPVWQNHAGLQDGETGSHRSMGTTQLQNCEHIKISQSQYQIHGEYDQMKVIAHLNSTPVRVISWQDPEPLHIEHYTWQDLETELCQTLEHHQLQWALMVCAVGRFNAWQECTHLAVLPVEQTEEHRVGEHPTPWRTDLAEWWSKECWPTRYPL